MRVNQHGVIVPGHQSSTHGLEALFEYNGLVLNDRRQIDRYKLTGITGLDDADVRDTREPNPDYEGETAFGSLYGGRTITLTGEIQAGNLWYLRYMYQNLKAAFDDVSVERDLLIRWYDWYDGFLADSITSVKQDYLSVVNVGSEGISLSSDGIIPGSAAFKLIAIARQYDDYQNTLRFHTGSNVANSTIWLFGKWQNQANHMELRFETASSHFNIYQYSTGASGTTTLADVDYTLLPDTDYWLRLEQQGAAMRAALYVADPKIGVAPVAQSAIGSSSLGSGIVGGCGFGAQISSPAGWSFDSLDVRALNPGDMVVRCKKIAKGEGTEGWDGYRFKLPFMITLRASSSLKLSRQEQTLPAFERPISISSGINRFPASGEGLAFPIIFGVPLGIARNLGFAPSYTRLLLTGPLQDPSVINNTNGTRVQIGGLINEGESVVVDSIKRTVTDHLGKNRYDLLGVENSWLRLDPGDNQISSGAETIGEPPVLDPEDWVVNGNVTFDDAITLAIGPSHINNVNLIGDPSAEGASLHNWTRFATDAVFPTITAEAARYGTKSFHIGHGGTADGMRTTANIPVSPGSVVSAAAEFRAKTIGRSCYLVVAFFDSGGASTGSTTGVAVNDTTTGWTRATVVSAAAPAGTTGFRLSLRVNGMAIGESHYIDGVVAHLGPDVPIYVDGTMPGYKWNGTPNASQTSPVSSASVETVDNVPIDATLDNPFQVTAQIDPPTGSATGTTQMYLMAINRNVGGTLAGASYFMYDGAINQLRAYVLVPPGSASLLHAVTYNPTAHKWLRLRADEDANMYWEVSPDGQTWTELYSLVMVQTDDGSVNLNILATGGSFSSSVKCNYMKISDQVIFDATGGAGNGTALLSWRHAFR